MNNHSMPGFSQCEAVLAEELGSLASELRAFDAVDLIALIRLEKHSALASLLESSCELHFKERMISFADHAEALAPWDRPPVISLAMQFSNKGVEIHFRAVLEAAHAGVSLDFLRFSAIDSERASPCPATRVRAALADARRPPGAGHR